MRAMRRCRLCLDTDSRMTPIFCYTDKTQLLQSLIIDCCSIKIYENDPLPKFICTECEDKVNSINEFRMQCKKNDLKLRKFYKYPYQEDCPRSSAKREDAYMQTEPVYSVSVKKENFQTRTIPTQINIEGVQCIDAQKKTAVSNVVTPNSNTHEENYSETRAVQVQAGRSEKKNKTETQRVQSHASKYYSQDGIHLEQTQDHINKQMFDSLSYETTSVNDSSQVINKDGETSNIGTEMCRVEYSKSDDRQNKLNTNLLSARKKVSVNDIKKQYLCDMCSKTFVSKSGLRFHLKSHNGMKPYACKYCDKSFAIPSYKERHERTHTGDKHFVCHICSAAFASSNGLKYHLRVHTGEANYHCKTCGKSFRRCKYLKEHIFTHTGERPFVCKICGAAYGNSGSLFVHEKKCQIRQKSRDAGNVVKRNTKAD